MSISGVSAAGFDFSSLRAQLQDTAAAKFQDADADKSGGLSLEEFEGLRADGPFGSANAAGGPSTEELFSSLDADGDGELTEAERPSGPPGGSFSPDAFSSLLSAQEAFGGVQSSGSSILDILNGPYEKSGTPDNDLLGQLLDSISGEADEEDA